MKLESALHQTLALDIGGANIKACYTDHTGVLHAFSQPFLLSHHVDELVEALNGVVQRCPQVPQQWLVTMTGELCDCFENRKQGVHAILDAVSTVAGQVPVRIWSTTDGFVDMQYARENSLAIASANWHALASCLGRLHADQRLILIDTGSTTTDIIPVIHGHVATQGKTDAARLVHHELVYLGGSLTPLMALSGHMQGQLMNEFFATMHDLAVVMGACPQELDSVDSPDGMPYDLPSSLRRILRMFGEDLNVDWQLADHAQVIESLLDAATGMIQFAFNHVVNRHQSIDVVLIGGSGSWLPCQMLGRMENPFAVRMLQTLWGEGMSTCACARALIALACETNGK